MKSFRSKLIIGVCAVGLFAGVADAEQLVVFEAPLDEWNEQVSADFAVNRAIARAWIDVQLESHPIGDAPPRREVISKSLEGLYYDPLRKQVLYRTADETVVCAEDAKFLWMTFLKSTGQCVLTSRAEQRKVDDGFKIRDGAIAKVIFEALSPTASHHAAAPAERGSFRERVDGD